MSPFRGCVAAATLATATHAWKGPQPGCVPWESFSRSWCPRWSAVWITSFPLLLKDWLTWSLFLSSHDNELHRIWADSPGKLTSTTRTIPHLASQHSQPFTVPTLHAQTARALRQRLQPFVFVEACSAVRDIIRANHYSYCPESILSLEFLHKDTTTSLKDKICTCFQIKSFLKFMRFLRFYI